MAAIRKIGIFGGGPAGLSAGLWLSNLGFDPWIAETQAHLGGMQNLNFLANEWVLGKVGVTGPELAAQYENHIAQLDLRVHRGVRATKLRGQAGAFEVEFISGEGRTFREECAALVIATGTRYRSTEVLKDVPGFQSISPERVVYGPYAFANCNECTGKRLLIIGGGDNAFENVRLLAARTAELHVVVRSMPRAQTILREAVEIAASEGHCRLYRHARLAELRMRGDMIDARLEDAVSEVHVAIDRIHVLAGYEPNTDFLSELFGGNAGFQFDSNRYLLVDAAGRTGVAGVYAAGDICNPDFPSVVSALAQGARAARTVELDLRS